MLLRYFNKIRVILLVYVAIASSCGTVIAAERSFMVGVNSLDSTISIYTLDQEGTPRQQSFYPAAKNPKAVAIHPSGKFVYVVSKTAKAVTAYETVYANGRLELSNPSIYEVPAKSPFALAMHPSGKYLYVAAREGKIAAYKINALTGFLTLLNHSPFAAQNRTRSLIVHPSGKFLYAVNAYANSISAYHIGAYSGELTPIKGSPFTVGDPHQPIRSLWPLADVPQNAGGIPYFATLEPQGRFLYVANWGGGSITGFAVDQQTGALTELQGSPFATGLNPYVVSVHPSGKYLYAGSWESESLWAYAIDRQTGALKLLAQKSVAIGGRSPVSVVFDRGGSMAYVANSESANIGMVGIDIASGELSLLRTIQTRPGPWWLTPPVEKPREKILYSLYTLNDDRKLSIWTLDLPGNTAAKLLDTIPLPDAGPVVVHELSGMIYCADNKHSALHAYGLNNAGKLAEIPQSPWGLPAKARDLKIDANGRYLYVVTQQPALLTVFGIDPGDGTLIPMRDSVRLADVSRGGLVLDPIGRFTYVLGFDSRRIHLFGYRQNTGAAVYERTRFGSPLQVGGEFSAALMDPAANFLLLSDVKNSTLSSYRVHFLSGALTEIPASPIVVKPGISKMLVNSTGRFVLVLDAPGGTMYTLPRDVNSGEISPTHTAYLALPHGKASAIRLQGDNLYIADGVSKHLWVYAVDPRSGEFRLISRTAMSETVRSIVGVVGRSVKP